MIAREAPKSSNILDRYILARWYETHAEVTHHLDTHELDKAARPIMPFLDDLSTWYIRRSRDRFKSDDEADALAARTTTGWILFQFSRLIAPMMPFLAEDIYERLSVVGKKESVHLESWPDIGVAASSILSDMEETRRIVTLALEARAKAGIKVRQPLASLTAPKLSKELAAIVRDEVNVKEVIEGTELMLDTTITPELKDEGELRDLVRTVQDLRKKADLIPSDRITLTITKDSEAIAKKYETELLHSVGAASYVMGDALTVSKVDTR